MKKRDIQDVARISASTMSKLNRGMNMQTDVLVRTCRVLECDFSDIMEIVQIEWEDKNVNK